MRTTAQVVAIQEGSELFTYGTIGNGRKALLSVTVVKQKKDDPCTYRCKYTSNETGHIGKQDWIYSGHLFATKADALDAVASELERDAAIILKEAADARRRASCERGVEDDCPDAHLCRHGVEGGGL
jgi:hypothetical protein